MKRKQPADRYKLLNLRQYCGANFCKIILSSFAVIFLLLPVVHAFALLGPVLAILAVPLVYFWLIKSKKMSLHGLVFALSIGLTLLVLSVVCARLVAWEQRQLLTHFPAAANSTLVYHLPEQIKVAPDGTFQFAIDLYNIDQPINTVKFGMTFDPKSMEIVNLDLHQSLLSMIVSQKINNKQGWLELDGSLPYPGYSWREGRVLVVQGKAKKLGNAQLSLTKLNNIVFANNGCGTAVYHPVKQTYQLELIAAEAMDDIPDIYTHEEQKLETEELIFSSEVEKSHWHIFHTAFIDFLEPLIKLLINYNQVIVYQYHWFL